MSHPSKRVFLYSWELNFFVSIIFFSSDNLDLQLMFDWIFVFLRLFLMASCHCAYKNGSLVVQLKLLSFTSWKKKIEYFCNNKTSFSNSPLSMLVKVFVMQTIIRFVLCSNIYMCMYSRFAFPGSCYFRLLGIIFCLNIF